MPRPLTELRMQARSCTACPLWRGATQTVFGEGDPHASVMLVGEQPGDAEDLAGRPFVGPAGKVLERALGKAGLPRDAAYVTNVVKHFKWELRGKRRLHKTPGQREIQACRPWLEGEIAAVRPALIVCLGSTATHAFIEGKPTLSKLGTDHSTRVRRPGAAGYRASFLHPAGTAGRPRPGLRCPGGRSAGGGAVYRRIESSVGHRPTPIVLVRSDDGYRQPSLPLSRLRERGREGRLNSSYRPNDERSSTALSGRCRRKCRRWLLQRASRLRTAPRRPAQRSRPGACSD